MRHRARIATAALALAVALPAPAEVGPAPFPEFTFRRVGVPSQGAVRRITVQVAPGARTVRAAPSSPPRAPEAATPVAARAEPGRGHSDWFWRQVDPGMGGGHARLAVAIDAASGLPGGAPRLEHIAGIARSHGPSLLRHSVGTRVSPALALAVISTESAGRAGVTSEAGARGLMQLIPATAARFGVSDPFDPSENIRGGIAYLDWLLARFDGDAVLALAAYNAGEGAVDSHAGVPPYRETRAYVPKVLAAWRVARLLCATPPELVSDGCVFTVPTSAD
ncbi:MAG: lytic transglycosylase domain-containing protein [Hasllibacter sp.]